jgi:NADH-quinone oxidoreductase subunit F
VGREIPWEDVRKQYDAIYLAIGAHKSTRLGVEGEDLDGVRGAIEFLREVNLGNRPTVGDRVVVIGGGNSAIDAARSARRLGAKEVVILYRRLRPDMPAQEEEILAAEEEGVKIHYLAAPVRFTSDNGVLQKVVCQRMSLGDFDASGRRRPMPMSGEEFTLDVDTALAAIGQMPDLPFPAQGGEIQISKGGLIQVRQDTRSRVGEGLLFAGGDAVTGPDTVIGAIAAGHRAAGEIDAAFRELNGEPAYVEPPEEEIAIPMEVQEQTVQNPRGHMPHAPVGDRVKDFREVELGVSREIGLEEAGRCLRCDIKVA